MLLFVNLKVACKEFQTRQGVDIFARKTNFKPRQKKFTGSICFAMYVQWSSLEIFVFLTKTYHDI